MTSFAVRKHSGGQSGFTLIEMMVAIAILGAIAAMAVPNYMGFVARSRQSQAKVELASIFAAEKNFAVETGTYTMCLADAGYRAGPSERYYAVGFLPTSVPSACGAAGNEPCNRVIFSGTRLPVLACPAANVAYDASILGRARLGAPTTIPTSADLGPTSVIAKNTFKARAAGNVGGVGSSTYDRWSIDDGKNVINYAPAL